jgi:hypothetical protein
MDGRRFQAPAAVSQLLPPAYAAELSEDGEIFNFDDDDLPPLRQILAPFKQMIEMIDLTSDNDDDGKGDADDGLTEVNWLRNTRTA